MDVYRVTVPQGQATAKLNPNLKYLRVMVDGREIFMALGYVDGTPDGPVQVWYSARGDVLRLRDGRVVGATLKTDTSWLDVTFSHLPRWEAIAGPVAFERSRDVSPGYRYGIREKMLIRPVAIPDDTLLKCVPPSSLVWFEEVVQGDTSAPPARYAVEFGPGGMHQVVYAEQCLSVEFCFSWQDWPSPGKEAR